MRTKKRSIITKDDIVSDLIKLGVQKGDLLYLKVSLKSIGYMEGFTDSLIEALLEAVGPSGTIVSSSFIKMYLLPLLTKTAKTPTDQSTPAMTGALANALVKYPKSERSSHPIQKYVAIGAKAKWLTQKHGPNDFAYEVQKLLIENEGKCLKIGNDEKVSGFSTIHVAVEHLGFKKRWKYPIGRNYINYLGELTTFKYNWEGGCSDGNIKLLPLFKKENAILGTGYVGNAESKLLDMKKTFDIEVKTLNIDPSYFLCDDPGCIDCRLSWPFSKGNPLLVIPSIFKIILKHTKLAFNIK